MKKTGFISIFFGLITFLSAPVVQAGTNEALAELLKALEANGTISSEITDLVLKVAEQGDTTKSPAIAKEEVEKIVHEEVRLATKDQPKINMKDKFEVTSGDGQFSMRVGGRIQADAATYSEDLRRQNDGTEMRRARLFVQGNLWDAWKYKLQYDLVNTGSSGIADAYIQYTDLPWDIKVGHFKQPFSLQNMTSSKYITFTERGLPHLFTPGRAIGAGVGRSEKNWSLNAGIFGEGIDGASGDEDEGFALGGRATYAPILNNNQHLHLGASFSYRDSGSIDSLSFSDRPESHVTNVREVSTGSFNADTNLRTVAEAAYTNGPFSLQSEYYYVDIDRDSSTLSDLVFSGYYVEGSWFFTDDMRNYSGNKGSYGRIKPKSVVGKGGIGAWQLAMRFSSVDLNDADITGGDAQNFSLGLNWFATNNIRLSANYINVLDVNGGAGDGDEPEAFQMRAQVEF
ncbi:MAG: porin [Proteobacteria bacterium]|nr:porin [Pseudomonadota bacterium]NOG60566.1 porin [Pseudomonadota bacterium]